MTSPFRVLHIVNTVISSLILSVDDVKVAEVVRNDKVVKPGTSQAGVPINVSLQASYAVQVVGVMLLLVSMVTSCGRRSGVSGALEPPSFDGSTFATTSKEHGCPLSMTFHALCTANHIDRCFYSCITTYTIDYAI
jgi:hypothetical protein